MPKDQPFSLPELEQETQKFLAPSTDKERSIIEAAVELMGARGIDGATTAEIAKRAKVTERTLFRYFPSKQDLVKRVLAPVILRTILVREWESFGTLIDGEDPTLRSWYRMFPSQRYSKVAANPALSRTLLGEMTRNAELRDALAKLWFQHFWRPMVQTLNELKANGAIRKDVDVEALTWAIDCLNIGYLFLRHVYAANRKWDDARELGKMAEILARGSASEPRGASKDTRQPARAR